MNVWYVRAHLPGLDDKPGDQVQVMPDDYGKIAVRGEIVALSSQHIAIRRMIQSPARWRCISRARDFSYCRHKPSEPAGTI